MLAALHRKIQPVFLYFGQHRIHYGLRGFHAGARAYKLAHHFACRAAYNQYIARFKRIRSLKQFVYRGVSLGIYAFICTHKFFLLFFLYKRDYYSTNAQR